MLHNDSRIRHPAKVLLFFTDKDSAHSRFMSDFTQHKSMTSKSVSYAQHKACVSQICDYT